MGGMNLAAFTAPFQYARPVQQETPWDAAAKFGQLRALAQAQQLRQQELLNQQQQYQLQGVELQQRQTALDQIKAVNQAYMSAFTPDESGVPQLDKAKLTQALATGGQGSAIPHVLESITNYEKGQTELSEKQADLAAKQTDHGGEIGAVVKAANYDPHLFMTLTQDSMNKGTTSKARGTAIINALQQTFQQDPTGQLATQTAQQIADQLIANSPKSQALLKAQGEVKAEAQKAIGAELDLASRTVPSDPNQWAAWRSKFSKDTQDRIPEQYSPEAAKQVKLFGVPAAEQPKVQKEQAQYDAMQRYLKDPTQMFADLDAILPPKRFPQANAANKALLQSRFQFGDFDGIKGILDKSRDFADTIAKETDPQVQQYRINQHAAEAATAVRVQQAQYANSPLAGVPPHLATQAASAANKANQDYIAATSAAQEMKDFIDLMRAGNKVAYSYAPVTGVLTINTANGIKRMNMPEIHSYGAAGSAYDEIMGWLGGKATGESIPANIVNNMETLHGQLYDSAQKKYQNALAGVNQTYGAKFQPVQLPNTPQMGMPAGGGYLRTTTNKAGHKIGQKADGKWYDFQTGAPL